jgi:hypothetical protein
MRRLRASLIRLFGLVTAGRRTQQFDAELQSHLEFHIEDNIRSGMSPEEAKRQALIALGGMQSVRAAYRDEGTLPSVESLAQDVRFAARMLGKAPGSRSPRRISRTPTTHRRRIDAARDGGTCLR